MEVGLIMMINHFFKNIRRLVYFFVVLCPVLISGETSWGKNPGSINQAVIVYSGNTFGFTEATG